MLHCGYLCVRFWSLILAVQLGSFRFGLVCFWFWLESVGITRCACNQHGCGWVIAFCLIILKIYVFGGEQVVKWNLSDGH